MEPGSSQLAGNHVTRAATSQKTTPSKQTFIPSKKMPAASKKAPTASKKMFSLTMTSAPSVKQKDQPEKVGQHSRKKPKMDKLMDKELLALRDEISQILEPLQDKLNTIINALPQYKQEPWYTALETCHQLLKVLVRVSPVALQLGSEMDPCQRDLTNILLSYLVSDSFGPMLGARAWSCKTTDNYLGLSWLRNTSETFRGRCLRLPPGLLMFYITFLLYGLMGLTILDHIYSSFL